MIEQLRAEGQRTICGSGCGAWIRRLSIPQSDRGLAASARHRAGGMRDPVCRPAGAEKQIALLPDIQERLAAAGIACRMLVVGDGPDRAALEACLSNTVFAGFLVDDELAAAYASSTYSFFPAIPRPSAMSRWRRWPRAFLASAPTPREAVPWSKRALPAFWCRPAMSRLTRRGCSRWCRTPPHARMGAAGRARALGFSWDEMMGRMLGYYRAIVGTPS